MFPAFGKAKIGRLLGKILHLHVLKVFLTVKTIRSATCISTALPVISGCLRVLAVQ